jgi:hypothetical protein
MAQERILIPMLNQSFKVPKGPRWYLDNETYLDSIALEDIGLLSKKRDEYVLLLRGCRKCAYLVPPPGCDVERYVQSHATMLQFLFNAFREEHPVLAAFGAHVIEQRKPRVARIVEVASTFDAHRLRNQRFVLRGGVDRKAVSDFYQLLCKAQNSHQTLCLTLGRYNSALMRYDIRDRIVDISICLESLIEAQTEVSFKCALYNALIAEPDSDRREDAFKLLNSLYSARSKIVHGEDFDKDKSPFKPVVERWPDVTRLVTNALIYYVLYLSQYARTDWVTHLKRLALGAEPLITVTSKEPSHA